MILFSGGPGFLLTAGLSITRKSRVKFREAQRDSILQPRVARNELPWEKRASPPTLKGLQQERHPSDEWLTALLQPNFIASPSEGFNTHAPCLHWEKFAFSRELFADHRPSFLLSGHPNDLNRHNFPLNHPKYLLILPAELLILPVEVVISSAELVILPAEVVILPAEVVISSAELVILPMEALILPVELLILPVEVLILSAEHARMPAESTAPPDDGQRFLDLPKGD